MADTNNRRQFLKKSGLILLGTVGAQFFSSTSMAEQRRAAKKAEGAVDPLVVPGKGTAATLNFNLHPKDVKDKALMIERQGVKWGAQNCGNCMLYTKISGSGAAEVGKCTLFAGQTVKYESWCQSWSKKA